MDLMDAGSLSLAMTLTKSLAFSSNWGICYRTDVSEFRRRAMASSRNVRVIYQDAFYLAVKP